MIAWSGFIGKLVEFILTKVVGKGLDLAMDEKKSAAKAFLNLYQSLEELESVTLIFLKELKPFIDGEQTRLYRVPFDKIAREADKVSHQFVQSFHELHQAIGIYDSTLSIMLGEIMNSKAALIGLPAKSSIFTQKMTFKITPNPNSVFYMQCPMPVKPITTEILNQKYETAYEMEKYISKRNLPRWPKDLLLSIVQENCNDQLIADNNINMIKHLNEIMSKNIPLLSEARKNLAAFLQKNFSLKDILYVKGSK